MDEVVEFIICSNLYISTGQSFVVLQMFLYVFWKIVLRLNGKRKRPSVSITRHFSSTFFLRKDVKLEAKKRIRLHSHYEDLWVNSSISSFSFSVKGKFWLNQTEIRSEALTHLSSAIRSFKHHLENKKTPVIPYY